MLLVYNSTSKYPLRGKDNSISKDVLLSLHEKFIFYSYYGIPGFGYCSELNITDDPSITLYSVQLEKKFRFLKICNFDFIKSKTLEELITSF